MNNKDPKNNNVIGRDDMASKREIDRVLDRLWEYDNKLFKEIYSPNIKGTLMLERLRTKDPQKYKLVTLEWSDWKDTSSCLIENGRYGVYQIGLIDSQSHVIPIPRMGGQDDEGIIYIGRSGYDSSPKRSLSNRIKEFVEGRHSGAGTYELARDNCDFLKALPFSGFQLQYRVLYSSGDKEEVDKTEVESLTHYFYKFGELPPFNSSFPNKWNAFKDTLIRLKEGLKQY